jgi:hypothetical protein
MVREEVVAAEAEVIELLRFMWLVGLIVLAACSTQFSRARHAGDAFTPTPGSDGAGGGGGHGM